MYAVTRERFFPRGASFLRGTVFFGRGIYASIQLKNCCGLPRQTNRLIFFLKIRNVHHHCSRPRPIPVLLQRRRRALNQRTSPRPTSTVRTLRPLRRQDRHALHSHKPLRFGLLNIRSIHHKVDEALELFSDYHLHVLFLTETWHDEESTSHGQLRANNLHVVDRPRPRSQQETLTSNHGGVAVISQAGVRLTALALGFSPTSCEPLCAYLLRIRVVHRSTHLSHWASPYFLL